MDRATGGKAGTPVEYKYVTTTITFSVAPTAAKDCWTVTDMFGDNLSQPRVCSTVGGMVSVTLPANGSATGPIYLLP